MVHFRKWDRGALEVEVSLGGSINVGKLMGEKGKHRKKFEGFMTINVLMNDE